jgi:hypothetical protein
MLSPEVARGDRVSRSKRKRQVAGDTEIAKAEKTLREVKALREHQERLLAQEHEAILSRLERVERDNHVAARLLHHLIEGSGT